MGNIGNKPGISIAVLFILAVFSFYVMKAQKIYKVAGTYKGQAAQGMAIDGKYAFLFNNTGICRIFNLKTGKVERDFLLESSGYNHCNSASFGIEKKRNSKFPVIYVSQCNEPFKCFVENVTDQGSNLIQTIQVRRKGVSNIVHDWVVDKERKSLYAITDLEWDNRMGSRPRLITRYRLPKLSEGSFVELSDKDAIESFEVVFPNLLQGASINDGFLYLPTGRNGEDNREDAKRVVVVINLKKGTIEKIVDLMTITKNEPEDCDFYQGELLVYCGQEGGLYCITIN